MKAYSLIELLVVVSIIGMLAVFGIPAFGRYGKVAQFRDKTEEIKGLIERTYYLAKNPSGNGIASYSLRVDAGNLLLSATEAGTILPVSSVSMESGQSVVGGGTTCPTVTPVTCIPQPITFDDTGIKKRVIFTTTFNPAPVITVAETDLP